MSESVYKQFNESRTSQRAISKSVTQYLLSLYSFLKIMTIQFLNRVNYVYLRLQQPIDKWTTEQRVSSERIFYALLIYKNSRLMLLN